MYLQLTKANMHNLQGALAQIEMMDHLQRAMAQIEMIVEAACF
jgi:hypothetical protein